MAEEEEMNFQDPFILGSTLKFADHEEEQEFAPQADSDGKEVIDNTPSGVGSTLAEENSSLAEEIEALQVLVEEEEEALFGELPQDQLIEKQFMLEQAREEEKLRRAANLEIVNHFQTRSLPA